MNRDALRILAGIKPVPTDKSQLPPPVMDRTGLKVERDELRKMAGLPPTTSKPLMETAKPAEPVAPKTDEPVVKEAYKEAGEFESDLSKVTEHLKAAKKIMESASMRQHIKDTHDNYGVQTQKEANMIVKALEMTEHSVDAFYDKMVKASE